MLHRGASGRVDEVRLVLLGPVMVPLRIRARGRGRNRGVRDAAGAEYARAIDAAGAEYERKCADIDAEPEEGET